MTELRRMLPKRVKLTAVGSVPHEDKLGVFSRDVETVNNKPLYVSESNPEIAIWWAPPDYGAGYPTGLWLVGRHEKRGQDDAYHMRRARKTALEDENPFAAWETFCPTSECFEHTCILTTIIQS